MLRVAVNAEKTTRHLDRNEDVISIVTTLPRGNLSPARYYDAIEHLELTHQIERDDDTDAANELLSNTRAAPEAVKITRVGIKPLHKMGI